MCDSDEKLCEIIKVWKILKIYLKVLRKMFRVLLFKL